MAAREFHILLVEDNPADARLTLEAFREVRAGARVSHVKDGAEALDFLRRSGRFADVDVRKRYRSIDNPADILVIVVVDEHAAVSETDLMPGPFKRMRSLGMWLPIVEYADGYGFTYGARISFVDTLGPRSRISVPLTWGGERRAALQADRAFDSGPLSRVEGGISISRRENPHYLVADTRQEARIRAERAFTPWLRVGGGVRVTNVEFGEGSERHGLEIGRDRGLSQEPQREVNIGEQRSNRP